MPVDLDELARLADAMDGQGMALLSPLIRAAIAELRQHRAGPTWTRERPTKPDLYWVRQLIGGVPDEFVADLRDREALRDVIARDCFTHYAGPVSGPSEPEPAKET